jgi:hypothetical protein
MRIRNVSTLVRFSAAALGLAALLGMASRPAFDEPTYYYGPSLGSFSTARQLETLGAIRISTPILPVTADSIRRTLIIGACPHALGLHSSSLLPLVAHGVSLVALDCTESQLLNQLGGPVSVATGLARAVVPLSDHRDVVSSYASALAQELTSSETQNALYQMRFAYISAWAHHVQWGGGNTLTDLIGENAAGNF